MTRGLIGVVALAALAATGPAQAATAARCVAPHDARTLFEMALPGAIQGLTARCTPVLSPTAFLPSFGATLAERYRHEAAVDPARARKAIEAATGQDLSFLASDSTAVQMADTLVEKTIAKRVQTRDCETIDGLVALAAPMRADDMAEALVLAMRVAGPDLALPGGITVCHHRDEYSER
jgi:hypothetical protein